MPVERVFEKKVVEKSGRAEAGIGRAEWNKRNVRPLPPSSFPRARPEPVQLICSSERKCSWHAAPGAALTPPMPACPQAAKLKATKDEKLARAEAVRARQAAVLLAEAAALGEKDIDCKDLDGYSTDQEVSRVVAKHLGIPNEPEARLRALSRACACAARVERACGARRQLRG